MEMKSVLAKIDVMLAKRGTSAAAISREATGSPDTIRNWRRRVDKGQEPGASTATLEPIARSLGVPVEWLTGDGPDDYDEFVERQADSKRVKDIFDSMTDPHLRTVAMEQMRALKLIEEELRASGRRKKDS